MIDACVSPDAKLLQPNVYTLDASKSSSLSINNNIISYLVSTRFRLRLEDGDGVIAGYLKTLLLLPSLPLPLAFEFG